MDWAHAPLHRTGEAACYFITAGTYRKVHLLSDGDTRDFLIDTLTTVGKNLGVELRAWVVLSNHYHAIVDAPDSTLVQFIRGVHSVSAKHVNARDAAIGRRVWFQYWDKRLEHERSYFVRLNYIHQNPVHHGIVRDAHHYRWSSLTSFEREADVALVKTVRSFRLDGLKIVDQF